MASGKGSARYAENAEAISTGAQIAASHPLIAPLPGFQIQVDGPALNLTAGAWVALRLDPPARTFSQAGGSPPEPLVMLWPNPRRRAAPEEWAYVLARVRLHIVLGHLDAARDDLAWHAASWARAEEMMAVAGVGRRPGDMPPLPLGLPGGDTATLAGILAETGILDDIAGLSLGIPGQPFWKANGAGVASAALQESRIKALATGIRAAATAAVDVAGGARATIGAAREADTTVRRARAWVISEYPLLAALAASFTLIEDAELCRSLGVEVAAISDAAREIYFHPRIRFTEGEARFVMAHELLHAGLRHAARRQGRDPWLWNVACDFVINDWLIEMQVGDPPERLGYLHDLSLRGLSAEEVYDRIVTDLRWRRKLMKAQSMNGSRSDMLEDASSPSWWRTGGVDLDAFYRRSLTEGLELHRGRGRGLLPAGLVEEIRALQQPPVPWDVQLAQWLDGFFPPVERRRSFARAHRRQAATPDIARPAWVTPPERLATRTFGAIVDTSGSMDRTDLGKAIGAIVSYAMSRDVPAVRLVECDAAVHDKGYVAPEALLDRVEVRGRGGTVLMPAIRYLEKAHDFPANGPLLVITDGACDHLTIHHEHAFLLAGNGRLPFPPRGPVFRFT